jgi:hypothetical protein
MMIDRWLYTATALALASVFALEGTFATSLLRAFGEPTATLSLNPWAEGVGGIFLMLLVAALCREWRR